MTSRDELSSGPPDGGAVTVGDNKSVSMQLLQDVYNELTGKTEKLSKIYRINHRTKFEDICQLNTKITQLYEQYNIVASNCTVTLYHVDDAKEQFSSFERFRLYDSSSLSAVENIRLKYNFLIVLPKADRPQAYDIEIDIHSRAAVQMRSDNEMGLPKNFIIHIQSTTGRVDIEYVDYTVARNFQIAIQQWFDSLPQAYSYPIINFLKKYSDHIPFFFKYASAAAIAIYFYMNYLQWIPKVGASLSMLFVSGVLAFSTIFIVSGIAFKLGSIAALAIERSQPLSYLELNRGDETAIGKLRSSNRWNLLRGVVSFLLTVATSVVATWLVGLLGLST